MRALPAGIMPGRRACAADIMGLRAKNESEASNERLLGVGSAELSEPGCEDRGRVVVRLRFPWTVAVDGNG